MNGSKRAVFLDRDGVINESFGFRPPDKPEELVLLPGVCEAMRDFRNAGFKVFVVTNQGGVGLGYMTEQALAGIHNKLLEEVRKVGGDIDEIRACTHKPKEGCSCRKPRPGMLLALAEKHDINLGASYMVGDREGDIEAGIAAGTKTFLISSPKSVETKADHVVNNLGEVAKLLLGDAKYV